MPILSDLNEKRKKGQYKKKRMGFLKKLTSNKVLDKIVPNELNQHYHFCINGGAFFVSLVLC